MLQSSAPHHVETLFSQLECSARNPMRLYRQLLQRAAAQLDVVTADAGTLRAMVHLLQKQQCEQKKYIFHLETQLEQARARRERHDTTCSMPWSTKNGRTGTTMSSLSSSLYGACVGKQQYQCRKPQQQWRRGGDDSCLSTSRELRGIGSRRFTSHSALELAGDSCEGSSPPRHPSPLAMPASLPPSQESDGSNAWGAVDAGDEALLEWVLGDVLLLLLDDSASASSAAYGAAAAPSRPLAGNVKTMYDTVMTSIRILKEREGALKSRLQELEETVRQEMQRRRLELLRAEEQDITFGVPPDRRDPHNISDRYEYHHPLGQDVVVKAAAASADVSEVTNAHHTVTYSTTSGSPSSVDPVDSNSGTMRIRKTAMDSSSASEMIQDKMHGMLLHTDDGDDDADDVSLNDLAGETELLEYLTWKDSFLEQLLPSM
ncbi:hypothetical protein TraAM80_04364 [Trypanosoma rangeli]|uniref:Uncharacterized protein n=1 Tax=Trypanosoma rangeli TaxID=5698 RepID=A0A3S5IRB7_TRYRA|nr:uncharacterized protein TraAM80_04364 [Trypanosoma rangeli]RNF05729.1 hypothetical protein TraAM80_04364 [Trypanosoma rangeli]|eukprot:RNF05729.1 hypothetical protein TraAM80_04364 [Trypanosoma rangeli]